MSRGRRPLNVLTLAAGMGTRMRSGTIKLLHPVAGRPMLLHVLEAVAGLRPERLLVVVGHQADRVREAAADAGVDRFVLQKEQHGTGHAVMQAARSIDPRSMLLIVNGDLPTLKTATLRRLVAAHERAGAALSLITADLEDPSGYGRIVRGSGGAVASIVEHRDADAAVRRIPEINCGIYYGAASTILGALRGLRPDNVQGEYYLTDVVRRLADAGEKVVALKHGDADEVLGVNNRIELAQASQTLFARKAAALQIAGVTLLDPARTWIDPRARVGRDTLIYPDVIVEGPCVIGRECVIYPGSRLVDARIGNRATIKDHSVILDSRVGDEAAVGPFAHLRPGSRLAAEVKVGNFVEVKKTHLRRGAKASHLSYLGDADIGAGSNIGAGTITCNYDGSVKNTTRLGPGVFVGSDSQLVAPVTVGKNAYVAAGSTVTEDVPAGALVIGRARQVIKRGWVAGRKKKKKKKGRR